VAKIPALRQYRVAWPRLPCNAPRRGDAAAVWNEFLAFDDQKNGAGLRVHGVSLVFAEDAAHAGMDVDSALGIIGHDGDSAMHDQQRGGVRERGGVDFRASVEMGAANVGVVAAVGQGYEVHALGVEPFQRVGGAFGEVDDAHLGSAHIVR
jgi:hypothetical protein